MFLPLTIRHPYPAKGIATFGLALLIVLLNAFFLFMPGWLLQTKYHEMLLLFAFNTEELHPFNFFAYAFFYPNPYLFLFDIAGLLFFGYAVEARLGSLRTLILILSAIVFSIFISSLLQPRYHIAGMTGAAFGLLGAAFAIYAFSEVDGVSLLPLPPTYKLGFTYTWTILVILAYAAGGLTWASLVLREDNQMQIMGIAGLIGAFFFGIAAATAFLGAKLPLFHPTELDPTRQMNAERNRRREQLDRDLAEDGFGSSETLQEETHSATEATEQADFLVADLPQNTEINFGPREDSGSPAGLSNVESRKQGLVKLMMLKDYPSLSQTYQDFIRDFPFGCLATGPQFDLASALEKAFFYELALHAYERLIQCHPHASITSRALLQAARICMRFDGKERECIHYLETFLKEDVARHDYLEAHELIKQAKQKLSGVTVADDPAKGLSTVSAPLGNRDRERPSEPPSEANSSSMDLLMQPPVPGRYLQPEVSGFEEPPTVKTIPAVQTEELSRPDIKPIPAAIPNEEVFYTLIIQPKTAISLTSLAEIMEKRWELPEAAVRSRLKRQKGIIDTHLNRNDTKDLVTRCAELGQQVVGVAEQPQDQYETALDIESVKILQDRIEWRSGINTFRCDGADIRLISGGMVRVQPGRDRIRAQVSIHLRQPHLHLRLWEMLLETYGDPQLNNLSPRQALKSVTQQIIQQAPNAQITHAFHRTFSDDPSMHPLLFDDLEEFDNYNQWSLLAWARVPGSD